MGILVVEKDNKSAELIYDIFSEEIKELFFASNVNEALIAFRKYKISIIILDLQMKFIDLVELIHIIKNEKTNIKIIAINTNSTDVEIEELFKEQLINALVEKESLKENLYDVYKGLN